MELTLTVVLKSAPPIYIIAIALGEPQLRVIGNAPATQLQRVNRCQPNRPGENFIVVHEQRELRQVVRGNSMVDACVTAGRPRTAQTTKRGATRVTRQWALMC